MLDTMGTASSKNIQSDLESLCEFNSTPGEGITRILFTDQEIGARNYIKTRMKELGLSVREDAIGNIYGKLDGTNPEMSPVWTGSHIDTVYNAGQFDGMAGVIGGMEALRLIKQSNLPHKRDIEVIVFTSEEPTRFGKGCLGSRMMAGDLTVEDTKELFDKDGNSLESLLKSLGYNVNKLSEIKREKGDVYSCVELHIEQGAVLDSLHRKTGIVTIISAPTDIRVKVIGTQQHAGATPMCMRSDALTASAKIILKIEELARVSMNTSTVATVGMVGVFPGATNVIPGEVQFSIDLRSSDLEAKNNIIEKLRHYMDDISFYRNVKASTEIICHEQPMKADAHIIEMMKNICTEKNLNYNLMVSGAYHDSMFVAQFAPFGMIFVPSKNGISHNKDEWTDYEDIAMGVDILAETLLRLSNEVE